MLYKSKLSSHGFMQVDKEKENLVIVCCRPPLRRITKLDANENVLKGVMHVQSC